MTKGFLILFLIAAAVCVIALGLLAAIALASRSLAKGLMDFLRQLYSENQNTGNPAGRIGDQATHAARTKLR